MDDEAQTEAWLDALRATYEHALTGHLAVLNGGHLKEWRSDGLHAWSHLWGKLDALCPPWLAEAMADAPAQLALNPSAIKAAAIADAHDAFVRNLREE